MTLWVVLDVATSRSSFTWNDVEIRRRVNHLILSDSWLPSSKVILTWDDLIIRCFVSNSLKCKISKRSFSFYLIFYFILEHGFPNSQLPLSLDLLPLWPYALISLIGTSSKSCRPPKFFQSLLSSRILISILSFNLRILVLKFEDLNFNP
jgi:hypothetical protein